MKLYNSLTRSIEEFTPAGDEITLYSCGPTVYERAHIGNLASFIYADTLKRTLAVLFQDKKFKHVMNITDVDDKTIAASQAKYPNLEPAEALAKLTKEHEELFMKDLKAVGIDTKEIEFVRATENIEAMQELILSLIDKGFAYVAEDGIYFSIDKYKQAGKKYGQLVEITAENTGHARVNNDEYDKDSAHDFSLWKAQKGNEPAWDFEVNGKNIKGRPGWHIECSAMSVKYLGQPLDIHTGGVDLKFPHHENEIAQSTANNGDFLARLFFHNEHLLVDSQKMSKSLNNFYTLEDIADKGFGPLAFRLLVLQAHYRTQAHFSWENLQAAQNRLQSFHSFADLLAQTNIIREIDSDEKTKLISETNAALESDIDTPRLLAALNTFVDRVSPTADLLTYLDNILGIGFSGRADISNEQRELIEQRSQAKQANNFDLADKLRKDLSIRGIEINDTEHGPVWRRV